MTSKPEHPRKAAGTGEVTQLLRQWADGDRDALDRLVPLIYDELRRLAARHLHHERGGHTLAPSALVHEAFLRLNGSTPLLFESRAQFYGLVSRLMRQVLVDHARARSALKRGGGDVIGLDDVGEAPVPAQDGAPASRALDILALDQALQHLQRLDPRQHDVVELRFFGGLSIEETAGLMGISVATVKREWVSARAWLLREIGRDGQSGTRMRRQPC